MAEARERHAGGAQPGGQSSIRLDKWLWHARVTRTRTLAQKLVTAGKVRLNRTKVHAPSQAVKIGDVLTIALPRTVLVYEIVALAERRGSFAQASTLYVDRSEPAPSTRPDDTPPAATTVLKRPAGRDRRQARRLAGKPD